MVGFAAREIPRLPLNLVLLKGCSVMGVFVSMWMRRHRQDFHAALDRLVKLCATGKLVCHIQKVYPLADAPQALKTLAERKAMGKLILRP